MVFKFYCLVLFTSIFVSCHAHAISEENRAVPQSLTRERRATISAYHMIKKRDQSGGGGNDIISTVLETLPGMSEGSPYMSQMNPSTMVTYIMNTIQKILSDFGIADPPEDGSSSSGGGPKQSQGQGGPKQSQGQGGQKQS